MDRGLNVKESLPFLFAQHGLPPMPHLNLAVTAHDARRLFAVAAL